MIPRATLRWATCLRCDYGWTPAYPLSERRPKTCPGCSSRAWDRSPSYQPIRRLPVILAALAACTDVTLADLRGSSRTRRVNAWRAAVIVVLRGDHWTLQAIGRALKRHHSTIIYHLRIAEMIAKFEHGCSPKAASLVAALAAREREKGAA